MKTRKKSLILIGFLLTSSTVFSQIKFTTASGTPVLYLDCPVNLKVEKVNLKTSEKPKLVLTCDANDGVVTSTDQDNVFRVIPKKEKFTLTVKQNGDILTQESFVAKPIPMPTLEYKQKGKMVIEPYFVNREEEITVTAIPTENFSSDEYKESNRYIVKGAKITTTVGTKTISSGSFVPQQLDLPAGAVMQFFDITISRLTYDKKEMPILLKGGWTFVIK